MERSLTLLDKGAVWSCDPTLIRQGGLRRAEGCEYLSDDPAIWKVKGRTQFNTAAEGSAISGLRWLQFDTGIDLLVTLVGTAYRKAVAGLTGTFSAAQTGLAGTARTLDSVFCKDRHILCNGVDRNYTVAPDGAFALHGMLENTTAPALTLLDGTGFTLSIGYTIHYWIEERVRDVYGVLLKRNAGAVYVTHTGNGTAQQPTLSHPATMNPDATHWALFASPTNTYWPTGALINEVAIGVPSITDTRTATDPGLPGGEVYPVTAVTLSSGLQMNVPTWGAAPIATTGDTFEDSVVLNDVANPTLLRFSDYNNIEAFPSVNTFRVGNTKFKDTVRLVRTVGQVLVVGLADSVRRVDTLPRQQDGIFTPERVGTQIHDKHGVVGPLAGDTFTLPAYGTWLAYVSSGGIHATNGAEWDTLFSGKAWRTLVDVAQLSKSVLVNYADKYQLRFFYTPPGRTTNSMMLILHYHPSHLLGQESGNILGIGKITGPVPVNGTCACLAAVAGARRLFTGQPDGRVYLEDEGNTDASTTDGTVAMCIETAEVYRAGALAEATNRLLGVHHQAHPGQVCTVTQISRIEGQNDVEIPRDGVELDRRETTTVFKQSLAESTAIRIENSDALGPVGLDYIVVAAEGTTV